MIFLKPILKGNFRLPLLVDREENFFPMGIRCTLIHSAIITLSAPEGRPNSIANFDGGPWPDSPLDPPLDLGYIALKASAQPCPYSDNFASNRQCSLKNTADWRPFILFAKQRFCS